MITSHDGDEQRTYGKVMTLSTKELWIKAMDEEMESIRSNHI